MVVVVVECLLSRGLHGNRMTTTMMILNNVFHQLDFALFFSAGTLLASPSNLEALQQDEAALASNLLVETLTTSQGSFCFHVVFFTLLQALSHNLIHKTVGFLRDRVLTQLTGRNAGTWSDCH